MKKILLCGVLSISISAFASTGINSGASFDAGFSPHGGSLALVLKGINSARKSIHVAAYSFTSKPIGVVSRNQRNV